MMYQKLISVLFLSIVWTASPSLAGTDYWASVGADGGFIQDLAVNPLQPSTVYAVAFGHGLFRSRDGGQTWTDLSQGISVRTNTSAVVADPSRTSRVYAASIFGGVSRSDNSGDSWIELNEGLDELVVVDLAFDPQPLTLFALTRDGLFALFDGTTIWSRVSGGLDLVQLSAMAVDTSTRPSTLYATGRNPDGVEEIFRSEDGGDAWQSVNNEFGLIGLTDLWVDPLRPHTLWAATTLGPYRSDDRGETWTRFTIGTGIQSFAFAGATESGDGESVSSIYASSSHHGLFKSEDGGATWSQVANGLFNTSGRALAVHPDDPDTVFLGTSGGVFRSQDRGLSWQATNRGLTATDLSWVAFPDVVGPTSEARIYAGLRGVGLSQSTDGGRTWQRKQNGLPSLEPSSFAIDPANPAVLYTGLSEGIYGSRDYGETWNVLLGSDTHRLWALAIDPGTSTRVYAGSSLGEIFLSEDGGESWQLSFEAGGPGSGNEPEGPFRFHQLVIDPNDSATVYAAFAGTQPTGGGLLRSTDSGQTWQLLDGGLSGLRLHSVAIDPASSDRLVAAAWGNGIYLSEDRGATWRLAGFSSALVAHVSFDPTRPSVAYAATRGWGILRSEDGGRTWRSFSSGLDVINTAMIAVDPRDPSVLVAASEYHGVLELRQTREQEVLWLQNGRFKVEVDWRDSEGQEGIGRVAPVGLDAFDGEAPVPLQSGDSAILELFAPGNWEVLLKVLDGRGVNGFHWLFFAAATHVGYDVVVEDTVCSKTLDIHQQLGSPERPTVNTEAFPDCADPQPADCQTDLGTLCLGDGRFRVTMDWTTDDTEGDAGLAEVGRSGQGKSSEAGIFSFFEEENWDLLVKVLDGCAINGHFWVFSVATTNVAYDLHVTDTHTGAVWTSTNPQGQVAAPVTDSEAFTGCPD